MLSSKYWITNCILLTILAFSVFTPALAYAAPLANDGKDWQNINGNSWAWNYNPQNQLNKANVESLEVKWVHPIPGSAGKPAALRSMALSEGISAPLVIHDGKLAGVTNFLRTMQWDFKTGKLLWTNDYSIDVTAASERLPVVPSAVHLHGIKYWEGGNMILNQGIVCDIYGVNFDTGKTEFRIEDLCSNIPGNVYKYQSMILGGGMAAVGVWEKGKQFIYSLLGSVQGDVSSGRNFYEGIDMDTKNVVWRVFIQPPQDRADKDWALYNCDIGYFITTPCQTVAQKDRSLLEYDWQSVHDQPQHKANGVSGSWGQPVIDEDTGIFYIQSGNQSPYSNLTSRPGPNLYGTTIIALDINKGAMKWWVQTYPHDPYDKDCNWSGMLIDNPKLGKVYVKGCKDGNMFVINAETGKPLQRWNAITETYGEDAQSYIIYDPAGVLPSKYNSWDGFKEMLFLPWAGAGKMELKKPEYRINPTTVILRPGVNDFAGDPAYDGEGLIYYKPVTGEISMGTIDLEESYEKRVASWLIQSTGKVPATTTIVARDLVNGDIKWKWGPVPGDHRVLSSHMVVTGGLLVVPNVDGYINFLDKDTGAQLHKLNMGAQMLTGPSVGKDSDGNTKIAVIVGVGGGFFGPIGATNPGTVVVIGLSDKTAAEVKTTTVTSTSSTTVTSTSVTTSITTSSTTVTTATTQTVTTASATTVTSTLAPKTTTITSNAPAQTVTATQQVTQTSGLPSEVTYAAVGVAVIALAAAAFLVMRKK